MIAPSAAAWLATLDGHTNQDTSSADIDGAFATLPIIDFDKHIGRHLHAWRDWIETPPGSAYWRAQSYQSSLSESRIPMLHISGWYDDCLGGAIENFAALAGSERSPDLAANQWLLIGPWTHNSIGKRISGGIDFGPSAELDVAEVQRNWFSARLGGSSEETAQVRLFVMGRNEWIEARDWPPAGTLHVRFYLHSSGGANSRLGDGALSLSPPMDEPPDRFTYDPCNPVPYAQDFDWKQVGGPDDCAELELRQDILVYTSAPLTEPLTICGPLIVRLFAASSAVDTDWTAKLLDVHPDGKAIRLNDGAVRARFRDGPDPQPLQCGAIEEYVIDCWATCIELPAGHRLRLEIASSAFGKFDVNMNGGGPIGREHQAVTAEQTVFHDRMRPSHILLPVLSTL
jgi:putative CocE/NonD family hydrolase